MCVVNRSKERVVDVNIRHSVHAGQDKINVVLGQHACAHVEESLEHPGFRCCPSQSEFIEPVQEEPPFPQVISKTRHPHLKICTLTTKASLRRQALLDSSPIQSPQHKMPSIEVLDTRLSSCLTIVSKIHHLERGPCTSYTGSLVQREHARVAHLSSGFGTIFALYSASKA